MRFRGVASRRLAWALLWQSGLLLLDEHTAALDSRMETVIGGSLARRFGDTTKVRCHAGGFAPLLPARGASGIEDRRARLPLRLGPQPSLDGVRTLPPPPPPFIQVELAAIQREDWRRIYEDMTEI